MVQKTTPVIRAPGGRKGRDAVQMPAEEGPKPSRGRPRLHDRAAALSAAVDVFWACGLTGASLDDLAAAMGMNRPSIYLAFGDKDALYRQALDHFRGHMAAAVSRTLAAEGDCRTAMLRFFNEAIRVYTVGDAQRGCMVMCTAPAVALSHPEVRADLGLVIKEIDSAFRDCIRRGQSRGEFAASIKADTHAMLLQAVLHSIAIRARAGESTRLLKRLAREVLLQLLPSGNR